MVGKRTIVAGIFLILGGLAGLGLAAMGETVEGLSVAESAGMIDAGLAVIFLRLGIRNDTAGGSGVPP